jgi:hypothetical protein
VTGGNRNDVTQLIPLVESVPPVRGKVGRPRKRPDRVTAARGYDHDKYRRELRRRGIGAEIGLPRERPLSRFAPEGFRTHCDSSSLRHRLLSLTDSSVL